ncbi:hypothetical protein [Sandaracinus amylolyticus]|uniref:Light-harvesting LHII, alpha subunit B / Histone protein n=1 Tax=Sandaracinus amylolyticus TaxID=927083 RepID=A0A0F6W3D1_9BACT|nr:hypothetical protein [Sandaracinus amylolyticus]AKF06456.1 Light-harvesting LHII, alpha subunit B / Histone protein [Sandaracinus amylolyticus]
MAHEDTTPTHAVPATRPRPDDTPPRNRVIFTYTVLAVITLIGLKYVFDSYMDVSRRDRRRENIEESRTTAELAEYRESQREALRGGAMPVDRAIDELGRRGRGAFPLIRPAASQDLDPLRGWQQLPRELPAALAPAAAPTPEATPVEAVPAEGEPGTVPADGATPTEGAAPAEGAAAAEGAAPAEGAAAPAPAPAAEAAAAPAEAAPAAEAAPRARRPRPAAAPAEGAATPAEAAPPPAE